MTSKTQNSLMDRKYTAEFLTTTITNFIQTRLIDHSLRHHEKEQSAERLSVSHSSDSAPESFEYSEQAVLANLDWGIDALSEAIATQNSELKLARLAHSERMLQVCALLDPTKSTAGVPNSYLSAWAHLNLAYLSQTRGDGCPSAVFRVFEMFEIDPFFARIDFAPELWEALFLPHMGSIVGWYSEARHRIVMETIPDASDLSLTADFDDRLFSESLIMSVRPDQAEKLKGLEKKYGESLDCNTRMFAKYYKEVVGDVDSNYGRKGRVALPPIAEPPGSPRREVGRNIPDFVKFGPILPKSAGFIQASSPGNTRRATAVANFADETENSKKQILTESLLEEDENDSYYKGSDREITRTTTPKSRNTNCSPSPSQTTKNESEILLQLLSNRYTSPLFRNEDKSESSPELSSPSCVNEPDHKHFLSKHSSPMLSSPLHRKTPLVHSVDESEMRRSRGNISPSLHNQHYTDRDHPSPSSAYIESEEEESSNSISHPSSEKSTAITRPPKDFICPITGQFFIDPVTLETGQTYERRAIEEWIKRGNTTCPITRQLLSSTSLPRTNYVLKRLITSWIEQNPEIANEFSYAYTPTSTPRSPVSSSKNNSPRNDKRSKRFSKSSPTSVISQAATEKIINELKPYTSCLCTSEDLQECENAIIEIARILKEVKGDLGIYAYVSKPTILNGFVEVISASVDREVLRTSVYVLSELLVYDESVGETLTNVDADFDSIASLLINGLFEAAVLIYQLRPSYCQLTRENLVPTLIQIMMNKGERRDDEFLFVMEMKDAAVGLLEQILSGGDEVSRSINASSVVNANGVAVLVKCLDRIEGRVSVVGILLNCMRYDKSCKMMIAKRAELLSVLELFHCGDDSTRSICVEFISELTCLNRRTFCNQVLQMIKDEGAFSMMHSLLVYLPMASMEQQPAVASLLLQLDLLVEPRKTSIYREEAIDALIEALKRKDFPVCQIIALDVLSSLSGRLTSSGVPIIEAWLLKLAGVNSCTYDSLVKEDGVRLGNFETEEAMEEEALSKWEKRVAFVLCNHDSGTIFKALEECLKSNSMEMAKSSLVVCTWLVHMLILLPETGIKVVASRCLLNQIIEVLHSSRNLEEKVLAALCLKTFVTDPDALRELGKQAKCIYKPLRKLKRHSPVVIDTLKAILNLQSVDAAELWYCSELFEIDCTFNGEVLSLVHKEGRLFSSHSDGTIKIWDVGRRGLRLVQEVREHTKAVTCLYIPPSSNRLYSGSLDKTIRLWEMGQEISRVEVHDVKEIVQCLATSSNLMCFATQGTGVKVTNGNGSIRHVNFNRSVKCLAVEEGNLYCGCTGYSIQEVNLSKCTTSTFYSGTRKILGKQTIHAICAQDGVLYAGGSSVDGLAGKAFSLSTKTVIGSFSTGIDIHCISLNNDFVFTGTRCGLIEVWLKERMARVGSIRVSSKVVTTLVSDYEGDMLFSGSSDGKIQVWSLD